MKKSFSDKCLNIKKNVFLQPQKISEKIIKDIER